ncbi:MAG: hypothetical protein ACR65U_08660 [Methylocystis sp.]
MTGGDLRAFGAWMLEKHDTRIALFEQIRAALRARKTPQYHDAQRLVAELRLEADAPDDLRAALGLESTATVEAIADRLKRKWSPPQRGRSYGGEEPVRVIACRDREVA